MRMGRVYFRHDYIIDLDNPEMFDVVREMLVEDVSSLLSSGDIYQAIAEEEDSSLRYEDILDYLRDHAGGRGEEETEL